MGWRGDRKMRPLKTKENLASFLHFFYGALKVLAFASAQQCPGDNNAVEFAFRMRYTGVHRPLDKGSPA